MASVHSGSLHGRAGGPSGTASAGDGGLNRHSMSSMSGGPRLERQFTENVLVRNSVERQLSEVVMPNEEQRAAHEDVQFLNETDPRVLMFYVSFASVIILISLVILILSWNEPCDELLHEWLLAYIVAYIAYVGIVVHKYYNFRDRARDEQLLKFLKLGFFIWWILGQVWLYATNPTGCYPPLWGMCLALITLDYVRICLPCIVLCTVCCWYPYVSRYIDQHKQIHGADSQQINELETKPYDRTSAKETSCCICLMDFEDTEELRVLPCKHEFHMKCVDEWLVRNRTCPLCRQDILRESEPIGAQGPDNV